MLAAAGIASRRAAEDLIEAGRVKVDGRVVRVQGMRVDPEVARVEVDGKRVSVLQTHEYFLLNKPQGVVSTASDPGGRRTVVDLVESDRRLFPVGRLDMDTTGALIITSDGDLAHRLAHPRYGIPRTYVATVRGKMDRDALSALRTGVQLEDGPARARSVRLLARAATRTQVELVLTEGRNHEVKRMLEAVGHPVVELVRTAFGPVGLGSLKQGHARRLTPAEVGSLLEATGS